ncbi:hypothetical protein K9L05_03015 [Candidatus Babeliales bacterium]|nr:hypothetical protein [Candidatus Babeliales bacterium]MCF7899593.1 hypothetical protein [Candidatus Babeliales bacterium]
MIFKKIIFLILFIFSQNFTIFCIQKQCLQSQEKHAFLDILDNLKTQILLTHFINLTIDFNAEDFYEPFLRVFKNNEIKIIEQKYNEIIQNYLNKFEYEKENCLQRRRCYKKKFETCKDEFIEKTIKNLKKKVIFYQNIIELYLKKKSNNLPIIHVTYIFKLFKLLENIIELQKNIQQNMIITSQIRKDIMRYAIQISIILDSYGNTPDEYLNSFEINKFNYLFSESKILQRNLFLLFNRENIIQDIIFVIEKNYKIMSSTLDIVKNLNKTGSLSNTIDIRTELSIFIIETYFSGINTDKILEIQDWFFSYGKNLDQDHIKEFIKQQDLCPTLWLF